MKRRNFIKKASVTGLGLVAASSLISCKEDKEKTVPASTKLAIKPLVIATWKTDLAVETAADVLENGGSALDAV